MGKNTDHLARSFETENTGSLLAGFLAEEEALDRSALWRLGSWGAAAVGVVIVALLASQSSIGWRREQVAAADLLRQSQQIQALARESQNETRRLASAFDTLNSDRDRLYSRVTVLEQGLDSVTGAITRQNPAAPSASVQPAPAPSPAAETQPAPQSPGPAPAASPLCDGSGCVSGGDDSPHARKTAHGAFGASRGGGLVPGAGNFKCAGRDAVDAAHGVEIDHGPAGFHGRKADRARPDHAAQARGRCIRAFRG